LRDTPLVCNDLVDGNYNDAFDIDPTVEKMIGGIQSSGIAVEEHFFDELLYKCRFVVECTNAWLDASIAVLVRFELNPVHCP